MKKTNSNIKKFYFLNFFSGLCFCIPILYLIWSKNGLSMAEIMIIQSVFSISVVILEVPSWYFADIFGRKVSIIIWVLAWFLGNLTYLFIDNFVWFLLVEILFDLLLESHHCQVLIVLLCLIVWKNIEKKTNLKKSGEMLCFWNYLQWDYHKLLEAL